MIGKILTSGSGVDSILVGDCLEVLRTLPAESVHCVVTSPPYWGLRDYGIPGQLGLEPTPEEYVAKMVEIFREVRRILRDDGVLFLNLGDSYASSPICAQSAILREDITDEERCYVAVEMFGLRIDGYESQSQGPLPFVLPRTVGQKPVREGTGLAGEGIKAFVPAQQGGGVGTDAGEPPSTEVGCDSKLGREMRMLRRNNAGVPDGGSRQQRRGGTSQGPYGEEPGQFGEDIQGHPKSGLSERQISSSVLQLQLLKRVLGILSSHAFAYDEIPDSCRFAFTHEVAIKPKDLVGIPWRVAFALQADGWYLRSDIIWHKPNPMPESVTDRPTKAHEYLFLLSKSARYWYDADAIKEPLQDSSIERGYAYRDKEYVGEKMKAAPIDVRAKENWHGKRYIPEARNRRTVWTVATQPFPGAHFATFPPALIEPCILAGCPRYVCSQCGSPYIRDTEVSYTKSPKHAAPGKGTSVVGRHKASGQNNFDGAGMPRMAKVVRTLGFSATCNCKAEKTCGIVLDPFMGAGTTAIVALKHGRHYLGIELNPEYAKMAENRIRFGTVDEEEVAEAERQIDLFGAV